MRSALEFVMWPRTERGLRALGRPRSSAWCLVAFAWVSLAPWPALADPPPSGGCLSPEVGRVLGEQVRSHAWVADFPEGFALDHVNIGYDRITAGVREPGGAVPEVELAFRGRGDRTPDGRGREFAFFLPERPLEPATRRTLLGLARRIDAALSHQVIARCEGAAPPSTWEELEGPVPLAYALGMGTLEILVVALALLVAWRGQRAREAGGVARPGRALPGYVSLALFVGAYVAFLREGGLDPIAWLDTAHDESAVRACLRTGACATLGQMTSVQGLFHAVGWLDFRAVLATMGLDLDRTHRMLLGLDAWTVVAVANLACRLGGRATAAAAALVAFRFVVLSANVQAVYNTVPLFFVGASFLAIAVEATERPDARALALFALVAAVLASVHAVGVIAVVSPLLVAMRGRHRRIAHVALVLGTFTATIVAIGPLAWIEASRSAWAKLTSDAHPASASHGSLGGSSLSYAALAGAAIAVTILARRRLGDRARIVEAAAVVALPMLVVAAASGALSSVRMNPKYLAHAAASFAVLAAVPVALASRAAAASTHEAVEKLRRAMRPALASSPVLAAAYLGLVGYGGTLHRADLVTFSDVRAVLRELRTERHWGWARTFLSLKGPHDTEILECLDMLGGSWPLGEGADGSEVVRVLTVPASRVPSPLPRGWVVANRSEGHALVLAFGASGLDWRDFRSCSTEPGGEPSCHATGFAILERPECVYCVRGMNAREGRPLVDRLSLRVVVPLHESRDGAPRALHMARIPGVCGGRIARIDASSAWISSDGSRATFVPPDATRARGAVELVWEIDTPACDAHTYGGLPPFFFEGDVESVRALDRLGMARAHDR